METAAALSIFFIVSPFVLVVCLPDKIASERIIIEQRMKIKRKHGYAIFCIRHGTILNAKTITLFILLSPPWPDNF
jgi:hypothetical protein